MVGPGSVRQRFALRPNLRQVETAGLPARAIRRLPPWARAGIFLRLLLVLTAWGCSSQKLFALDADAEQCRRQLWSGQFDLVMQTCRQAVERREYGEHWRLWKAQAELATGRYSQAAQTLDQALLRYSWSLELRWLKYELARSTGRPGDARRLLREIDELATESSWRYTDAGELLVLGHASLELGVDPRRVLEGFYRRAREADADAPAALLASGELALAKHDSELAAEFFEEAAQRFPGHPDAHFGLARATATRDPTRSQAALSRVDELNPNHVGRQLHLAEQHLDAERESAAAQCLEKVLSVNPLEWRVWALRAAMAWTRDDPLSASQFRSAALFHNRLNAEVDHIIGKRLSRHYRFSEGARFQRLALNVDPRYVPAQVQLAQDLLRLGEEQQGWEVAEAAFQADEYDLLTFNLLKLRDQLAQFETLESEHFIVRMGPTEAAVYGARVLELLERAHQELAPHYGVELTRPVLVEIFPSEADFAVRTFGVPGVSGFLGVCFGHVITANSPVSQAAHPSCWEATLWHEFCHVLTLQKTRHRIPRWLSEGISVYEEHRCDARWGQEVLPEYRRRILEGRMTPVAQLSRVFIEAHDSVDVQFAYYQSFLVVSFIEAAFGHAALLEVLDDLASGIPANAAIERRLTQLELFEMGFREFATQEMQRMSGDLDWSQPDASVVLQSRESQPADTDLARWVEEHPCNVSAALQLTDVLIERSQFSAAVKVLRRLQQADREGMIAADVCKRLAHCGRELNDAEIEIQALETWVRQRSDALEAVQRLLAMSGSNPSVEERSAASRLELVREFQSINPMLPECWQRQRELAIHASDSGLMAESCRALLALGSGNAAQLHYELADALDQLGDPDARRHVLRAIEQAPRFREAHVLLARMRQRLAESR